MNHVIDGGNLPVLKVFLEAGEQIQCEAGAMAWMDEGIEMQTTAGGIGQMLGRMFTNENAFMNSQSLKGGIKKWLHRSRTESVPRKSTI